MDLEDQKNTNPEYHRHLQQDLRLRQKDIQKN